MSKPSIEVARVVVSAAGRDRGRAFVVLAMEGEFAHVADGRLRKVEKPKKKKLKHLRAKPEYIPTVLEKLSGEKRVLDSEIRNGLDALGYAPSAGNLSMPSLPEGDATNAVLQSTPTITEKEA